MYQFKDKKPGEKVIGILRKHPLSMIKAILWFTVMIVGIISSIFLLKFGAITSNYFAIILLFCIGMIVAIFVYYLYIWNNDFYILTNYRVIDVDQHDFFRKTVTETDLDNIQEITYKILGPLGSLFNFGDVVIQTAGPAHNIILETIPNPVFVQNQIGQARSRYLQEKGIHKSSSESFNGYNKEINNINRKGVNNKIY